MSDFTKISEKYQPLFELIRGEHPEVYECIITGGRDSQKSFASSMALCDAVVNHNHRVLYTRYTLTSAADSIIPDFLEKVDILGYNDDVHVIKDRVQSNHSKGKVVFKGFKSGSGNQTANLKSLKDFSILLCEEYEEFPDEEEVEKVELSIRATDVHAVIIKVMNPTSKTHHAYKKYFTDKGVKEGFNGIKDGVMYIHTTYLDMPQEFIAPKNLRKYQIAKEAYDRLEPMSSEDRNIQPKKDIKLWKYYKHVVLGGWLDAVDGIIFDDWETYKDDPEEYSLKTYGLDFGFSDDPNAFVQRIETKESIYLRVFIYKAGLLMKDLAALIKDVIKNDASDCYIIADHDPQNIAELHDLGLFVIKAKKPKGSIVNGINKLKQKNLYIHEDSVDLINEANSYHSMVIINSKGETTYHIVDKDNHAFDAGRYAGSVYPVP